MRCGEVWRSVWRCVGKSGGSPHTLLHVPYTSPHIFHTHPTPLPHPPNTSPPHSPDTSLDAFPHSPPHTPHTFSHTFPHLPPHPSPNFTLPDLFPSPPPTLPHTHSPYFLMNPRLLQHFPILYHLPHTKISLFSHLLPN